MSEYEEDWQQAEAAAEARPPRSAAAAPPPPAAAAADTERAAALRLAALAAAERRATAAAAGPSSPRSQRAREEDAALKKAKRELEQALLWRVSDEQHLALPAILATLDLLHLLCDNVLAHPSEAKYRRVKAAGAAFSRHVASAPAALEWLQLAGWRSAVDGMERAWACAAAPGTLEWRVLAAARDAAARQRATIGAKLARAPDGRGRAEAEAARREAVKKLLADDAEARARRFVYASQPQEEGA